MGRIQQLSKNIINQIAAGEVIERPYSVVKELVENSIDAGATKISIDISNECRNIRIADNGCGIHPDDIVLAFSKHATSKIEKTEDLYNIRTLGFRGEALASIISISKLTCITRTSEFETGTKVTCENSEVEKVETGCAIGTIMEVKDLFYNLPVRLKFLKNPKTEFAYISELITSIALVNTNISFELKNNEKTVIKTNGLGSLPETIKHLYSRTLFEKLKPVSGTDNLSGLKLSGYISTPDFTRSSKKDYHIFVNSRTVKCPVFLKSIDMAYKNMIPNGKYPFVVLNLELPPDEIDINVHPTKKEVKYKNPNQIFNFIRSSITNSLSNIARINTETPKEPDYESFQTNIAINDNIQTLFTASEENTEPEFYEEKEEEKEIKLSKFIRQPQIFDDKTNKSLKQHNFIAQPQIVGINNVPEKEENIVGQYKNTYILIETEEGLEIVDQHIADERYIYETLKSQKEPVSQLLFISDIIELSAVEAEILKENIDKFAKFGYGIEFLNDTDIMFRKVPQLLSKTPPKDIIKDIIENIEGDLDNLEEKILITTSCKAAIKANTPLNMFQMQEIIKRWRKCKHPYTCPHGRPICKLFKHNEIAAFFMRNE